MYVWLRRDEAKGRRATDDDDDTTAPQKPARTHIHLYLCIIPSLSACALFYEIPKSALQIPRSSTSCIAPPNHMHPQ